MKDLKLFGMRIKDLRMARKLSQERLAKKADISSKYMSRIEMGQHFPSFDILTKLANVLNVDLKDFFEFTHEGKNAKELRRIISELLKDADEERLRLVVKILRGVVR